MKKLSCLFFVAFLMFSTRFAVAEVVWSIGAQDASYAEFFAAGDYPAVAEKFPDDVAVDLREGKDFDAKTDFPWMLPGPKDEWAGAKPHTVAVTFDAPAASAENADFLLEFFAVSQQAFPPALEISLNGQKLAILPTPPGVTGDRILETADGAQWRRYRLAISRSLLEETGNVLQIKNGSGAWIIFDCIRLSRITDTVDTLYLTPERGVRRGAENTPTRAVRVEYGAGMLGKAAVMRVAAKNDDRFPPVEIPMNWKEHCVGAELAVPVPETLLGEELTLIFKLKQQNPDGTPVAPVIAECVLPPEKMREVHLIHQTHLDIGYTHLQTEILARQVQSLRDALRYIDETKDYPEEARFKFHPEGMWAVEAFLKEATDDEKAAFIRAAKARDIHLDGMYAQAMTGMYNDEELLELFSSAARFCRENDIPLDSVMQTDVPGYTWGLVTAMGQNGIKYMTMGPNTGHRVGRLYHWGDRPFWWLSPSGKEKVLCWLLDTGYHQFFRSPWGHYHTEAEMFSVLDGHDWLHHGNPESQRFPFPDLVVIRYGNEGDNGRPNRALSDFVRDWNAKYLYPKLIISRNSDVMRLLETRYGDTLPTVRGDLTPYWEDGAASTTEATAINRRACEKIISAGVLWSMFRPKDYPTAAFDEAWTDLIMYDEHTWGAHNSISQPDSDFVKTQDDFKQEYARRGSREVNALVKSVMPEKISTTELLVVNTLSRIRQGICYLGKARGNLDMEMPDLQFFRASDGKTIPVQFVKDADSQWTWSIYADFHYNDAATKIPAMGAISLHCVGTLSDLEKEPFAGMPNLSNALYIDAETGEMGNDMIRLKIDKNSGAISSLDVTGISHDLVDAGADGNRGLNDYLYILGRNAEENRARSESPVKLTVIADGPLVAVMRIESGDDVPNADRLIRQITIFADTEKIKIENVLDKRMERRPEGTFFAFPFNVPGGKWHLDTPWASVEVEKDQLPGANRNYYPLQRYGVLANEKYGINWVTVDANLVQFSPILFAGARDGVRGWRERFADGEPGGLVYSWVCNNHWETNYKAGQDGRLVFEYWIWPYVARFNNAVAQRFARQVHQPLVCMPVSKDGEIFGPRPSLFTLENDGNVVATSVRPARDGSGALMVRLYNPSADTQKTAITLGETLKNAAVYRSNPLEDRLEKADMLELAPQETVTLRIE